MPKKKKSQEELIIERAKKIQQETNKDIKYCIKLAVQERQANEAGSFALYIFGIMLNDYVDYLANKIGEQNG